MRFDRYDHRPEPRMGFLIVMGVYFAAVALLGFSGWYAKQDVVASKTRYYAKIAEAMRTGRLDRLTSEERLFVYGLFSYGLINVYLAARHRKPL